MDVSEHTGDTVLGSLAETAGTEVVDVVPVSSNRRHTPGRSVRLHHQTIVLQGSEVVADRGGRDTKSRPVEHRSRADRFAGLDVLLDERAKTSERRSSSIVIVSDDRAYETQDGTMDRISEQRAPHDETIPQTGDHPGIHQLESLAGGEQCFTPGPTTHPNCSAQPNEETVQLALPSTHGLTAGTRERSGLDAVDERVDTSEVAKSLSIPEPMGSVADPSYSP